MTTSAYAGKVRAGYKSFLTSFSDDELIARLKELAHKYADIETHRYIDHFDYIVGYKN